MRNWFKPSLNESLKMGRKWPVLVALLATLHCAPPAHSLGGEHGPGDPARPHWNPQWPAGLKELVNRPNRIGGYWVNAHDAFYFTGDTVAFNAFLQEYAKLQNTPLRLVLHAGKASAEVLWSKESAAISDWHLSVTANAWRPEAVENKELATAGYTVTLHLWLGGRVDLRSVKVPITITVASGGEIENFITQHKTTVQHELQAPAAPTLGTTSTHQPVDVALSPQERAAIVQQANQTINQFLHRNDREGNSNQIPQRFWGDAIAKLKPVRVFYDRVNLAVVLQDDTTVETGLYVILPISSYAPHHDERFTTFEKLTQPGDETFGEIYRYAIYKPKPRHLSSTLE